MSRYIHSRAGPHGRKHGPLPSTQVHGPFPLRLLLFVAAGCVTMPAAGVRAASFGLSARAVRQQAVPGCRPWSVGPPERCEYVREHCADMAGNMIDFMELHFCQLKDRPWASLLLQLTWTILMFLIMLEACDRFFCPSIERISEWMKLSPTVAGATLLAFGNGAADLFMQITMALSGPPMGQGFELALTEPLGTGMFVTHVVVAAIILVTPMRRVHVSRINFMKDCLFFLGGVAALLALLLRGSIDRWQILLPGLYYSLYICVTLLMDRGKEPLHADPRRHEVPHFRTTSYLDDLFVGRAVAELERELEAERGREEQRQAALARERRALHAELEREEERQAALAWERQARLRGREVPGVTEGLAGDVGTGAAQLSDFRPSGVRSNGQLVEPLLGLGPRCDVDLVDPVLHLSLGPRSDLDPADPAVIHLGWGPRSALDLVDPSPPLALGPRSGLDPADQAPHLSLSCDSHPPAPMGRSCTEAAWKLRGSCKEAVPGARAVIVATQWDDSPELPGSCTPGTCSGTAGGTEEYGWRDGRKPPRLLQYVQQYHVPDSPPLRIECPSGPDLYRGEQEQERQEQERQEKEQKGLEHQQRRIQWLRLVRSPMRVMLSLTLPLVSNRKGSGARYPKCYATLLPLVLPLLLAVYCLGFNPLEADWAGSRKLQAAAGACIAASLLLLLVYPAHGRLQGWLLGLCTAVAFLGSILWIQFCADEVVAITMACGAIFNVSSPVLTATFLSWASSAGDAISNLALARDGFPTMALTACFSSPLFVLLGGLTCTLIIFAREGSGAILLPSDDELLVLYGSCVVCSAVWVITMPLVFRYKLTSATAAMAIGMYVVFQAVYILYAL